MKIHIAASQTAPTEGTGVAEVRQNPPAASGHARAAARPARPGRLVPLLCLLAILGCRAFIEPESENILLNTDFENYAEGTPLGLLGLGQGPLAGTDIPGLPIGDRVVPQGTVCTGDTYSVRSDAPLTGQKSLHLQHARLPQCDAECGICEDIAIIDFVPISPDNSAAPILLFWKGRVANFLADTAMAVSVREADAPESAFHILIRPDRMEIFVGTQLEAVIGHDFTTAHNLVVRVSPLGGTFGVQVAGPGIAAPPNNLDACTVPNVACGTFSTQNFDPAALVLRMAFTGNPGSVSDLTLPEYRVDNVKITQE